MLTDHRMVWIGTDLEDDLVATPLPWAGKLYFHFKCKMIEKQLKKRSYPQKINTILQTFNAHRSLILLHDYIYT